MSSAATYTCRSRLNLPPYSELTEADGVQAVLRCDATHWKNSFDWEFVRLNTGCSFRNLELHLGEKAKTGILASGNAIQIAGATVHRTARTLDKVYIIFVETGSSNVVIENCLLRRAGCDRESDFARRGWLVFLSGGDRITIRGNDLAIAASAGICFTTTTRLTIENNLIHDTGRALQDGYIADGITSYHNGTGSLDRKVVIRNNTIWKSRNHGIHLSGRGFGITANTIRETGITGIASSHLYIGDQKSPADITHDVWLTNNTFPDGCPKGGGAAIKLRNYRAGSIHLTGNTGCPTLYRGTEHPPSPESGL